MTELEEKVYLSKTVIELLAEDDTAEYEDLLSKLQTAMMPSGARVSEDSLLRYAQFVCDRVYHFDQAGAEDEPVALPPFERLAYVIAEAIGVLRVRPLRRHHHRQLAKRGARLHAID